MRFLLPAILLLLTFVQYALLAQTSKVIIPSISDKIAWEAEDYSSISTSNAGAPKWSVVDDAQASGGQAIQTDGLETITGDLTANRIIYKIDVTSITSGTYQLFIQYRGSSTGSFLPGEFEGTPQALLADEITPGEAVSYTWFDTGNLFELDLDGGNDVIEIIAIIPGSSDLIIDKIGLVRLVTGTTLPVGFDPDIDFNFSDNLVVQTLSGVAAYGPLESGASSDIQELTIAMGSTNVSLSSSDYPYVGTQNFQMSPPTDNQQGNNTSSSTLIFNSINLACFSNILSANAASVQFRWFSPTAVDFQQQDNLSARLIFRESGTVNSEISLSLLNIGGNLIKNNGKKYNLVFNNFSLPSNSIDEVVLELTLTLQNTSKVKDIWIDEVIFDVENQPETPTADFNRADEDGGLEVIFANESVINKPGEINYFWDFGDESMPVACPDGVTLNCNTAAAPSYEYSQAGTYTVCLTVTNILSQCRTSSTTCKDIIVEAAPLPVELTRFTATPQSGDVRLDWSTATETNNDFFQVEHSRDGASFTALARVPGNGDSQAPISYRHVHENAPAGINYYRLKQVDYDGAYEYSDVVTAQVAGGNEDIRLFPNPAHETVQLQSNLRDQLRYSLFDAFGRLLRAGTVAPQGAIDLSDLPGGAYHLRLQDEGGKVLAEERVLRVE